MAPGKRGFPAPSIGEFYSSEAEVYRDLWAPELLPMSLDLLPNLPLPESRSVLEVGAGVGRLLPAIAGAAPEATVVGVDIAEGMIALAPREFPRGVMDAGRLGLAPGSFDTAILAFCLFHVPEPPRALEEVHRTLRPGGSLGTITWGHDPGYAALAVWNEELDRHEAPPLMTHLARHGLVDTEEKVRSMFEDAGFTPRKTWTGMYDRQMSPEEFLSHRTGHGMARYRYEQLDPGPRASCLASVRRRLATLQPAGLRVRREVIYAVGEA